MTAKSFSVTSGYDEKKNADVTAAVFTVSRFPLDVLEIYRSIGKKDGVVSYGIYNTFRDSTEPKRPYFNVAAFTVDKNRTDFFSKPVGDEETMLGTAYESGFFFSNKPVFGNSLDPDPVATDTAVCNLLNSFKDAQSISITLFPDRVDMRGYTYVVLSNDLAALKDFCRTVTSSK
jgi:hypothetical protein